MPIVEGRGTGFRVLEPGEILILKPEEESRTCKQIYQLRDQFLLLPFSRCLHNPNPSQVLTQDLFPFKSCVAKFLRANANRKGGGGRRRLHGNNFVLAYSNILAFD